MNNGKTVDLKRRDKIIFKINYVTKIDKSTRYVIVTIPISENI